MAKQVKGTVEFKDIQYELLRADLQLIADALAIVRPDSPKAINRARYLNSMFLTLAESK